MYRLILTLFFFLFLSLSETEASYGQEANAEGKIILQTLTNFSGNPIEYPESKDAAEIVAHEVMIPPGGETGWHTHPAPSFMYVMEGVLVVELKDGSKKEYKAGEALIEGAGTWFNNKNNGNEPVRFIGVLYGYEGQEPVQH